jgi:hypothetical protein
MVLQVFPLRTASATIVVKKWRRRAEPHHTRRDPSSTEAGGVARDCRCYVRVAMKNSWRRLVFLLWSGTTCRILGAITVGIPVIFGVVRIALEADLPDHGVTHTYMPPPLKVRPRGKKTLGPGGYTRRLPFININSEPPRRRATRRGAVSNREARVRPKPPGVTAPRVSTFGRVYFFSMPPLSISSFVAASFFSSQDT